MLPLPRIERTRVGRAIEAARCQNLRVALAAHLARRDLERQARIQRYQSRAAAGLPLFDGEGQLIRIGS